MMEGQLLLLVFLLGQNYKLSTVTSFRTLNL